MCKSVSARRGQVSTCCRTRSSSASASSRPECFPQETASRSSFAREHPADRVALLLSSSVRVSSAAARNRRSRFSVSEDDIKAAVLYHLTQFVEWPGKNDGDALSHLRGGQRRYQHRTRAFDRRARSVRSHPIRVEHNRGTDGSPWLPASSSSLPAQGHGCSSI